jgi:hypothetical protein
MEVTEEPIKLNFPQFLAGIRVLSIALQVLPITLKDVWIRTQIQ